MAGRRLFVFLAVLLTAGALSPAPPIAAAQGAAAEHCVVRVIGQESDGELIVTAPTCYETYAAVSVGRSLRAAVFVGGGGSLVQVSFLLATHYDGANYTSSSFSIEGDDCNGGYLNLDSGWINRISSTANAGCYRTRHWTGASATGTSQDLTGSGGNLTTLNNAADSVQYLN